MPVSIHKRPSGKWEVRWRDHGRQRSRSFTRKRDAETYDGRVRRAIETGQIGTLEAGKTLLKDYGQEWWERTSSTLEQATRESYRAVWDKHILPHLGGYQLIQLSPLVVEKYRAKLERDKVGTPTIRKALAVLSAALSRAVVWGYIAANPVRAIRKPALTVAERTIVPVEQVELMRYRLLDASRLTDAVLICTLAYAGLRPEEALALRWDDVGRRTLNIARAVRFGEAKGTKTGAQRLVKLLAPLADDLALLREHTAGPLVFPRASDGKLWRDTDWRNWRRRIYHPAAEAAGLKDARPYTLRASFASLLIAGGDSIVEVAGECGHSVDVCARHYARLFAEYKGRRPVDPGKRIAKARRAVAARKGKPEEEA